MSDRFVEKVNVPIKKLVRARKKAMAKPTENKKQKAAKVAKVAGLGATQTLYWLLKYTLLTNGALRWGEDKLENMELATDKAKSKLNEKGKVEFFDKKTGERVKNNKFKAFQRRYPNFSAHVWYYILLAAMTYGGIQLIDEVPQEIKKIIKEKTIDDANKFELPDPASNDYVKQALDAYWNDIAIGLTELETYRATPKTHAGESRKTNGLGVTWHYTRGANGKLVQTANGANTPSYDKDTNYEQVRMHLEKETLRSLRNAVKGKDKINERHSVALVYAGYQRPADMAQIASGIQNAKTQQQVADAFQYTGKMSSKWKEGTLKRRWVCAAYAVGAINSDDLKKMHRDAFSRVELNNIMRNGHFLLDIETVKYVLSRTNKNETVENFLADFEMGRQILQNARPEDRVLIVQTVADPKIEKSMKLANQAEDSYKNKQYVKAAESYEQAIKIDPDNMEAYSSLALTYKKLGDSLTSIQYYEKSLDVVVKCNARMNANRALLFDHAVKAATYYNAGTAREAMAEIYKSQGDKEKMEFNYKKAQGNYESALYNIQQIEGYGAREDIYKESIQRMKKVLGVKDKTISFHEGVKMLDGKKLETFTLIHEPEGRA